MPYNPGVRDNSGAILAQGINQGKSALMQMIGWVMDQSSQNKQLEKTLSTAFPEQKDEIKGMSLDQKKGFMAGQYMKNQAQQQALSQSLQQSQTDLNTQKLGDMRAEGKNAEAMKASMRDAMPINETETPVVPGTSGSPFTANVPTYGQPTQTGLIQSMMMHPGSEQTDVGRSVLSDWMKSQPKIQGPNGQGLVGFNLGTGPNMLSGGIEPQTHKTILDPESVGRLAAARRQGMVPRGATGLEDLPADAKFTDINLPSGAPTGIVKVTDSKGKFIKYLKSQTRSGSASSFGAQFGVPQAGAGAPTRANAAALNNGGGGSASSLADEFKAWNKTQLQDEPQPFTDEHFQQWQDAQEN